MSNNGKPKGVKVHYNKTDSYRTYYADGFFGGLTPAGKIHIEPYIDKAPTPKSIDFAVQGNHLGDEVSRDAIKGISREIEAGMIFDINVAESLIVWLQQKVQQLKQQQQKQKGK